MQVWEMLSRILSKILSVSFIALLLVFQSEIIHAEGEASSQDNQEFQSLVPSLFGLTLSEVQNLLPQYDLTLGSVLEEESDQTPGTVLSQDQLPDSNVARFTAINISVAISREPKATEAPVVANPKETIVTEIPLAELPVTEKTQATAIETAPAVQDSKTTIEVESVPVEKKVTDASQAETTEKEAQSTEPAVVKEEVVEKPEPVAEAEPQVEPTAKASEDNAAENELENTPKAKKAKSNLYNGRKLTFTLEPEGYIQVSRKITMEMKLSPPADGNMQYQFNISGKPYNSSGPVFTHVFDDEETVIITASARLPGQAWLHSESQRVKVGKYVARKIKVPKIVGLSASKAAELLKSKGLVVGNTRDKIVKGRGGIIIEQMPKAGTIRTEDDNKIHYVKAVDEKFQVQLISKTDGLVTGSAVDIIAQVKPKPRSSKTRYSFEVNGETHYSSSPKWQYTFKEPGNVKVIAKAIINGEGTFESEPITLVISNAWKMPKAVISPYTLSAAAGETVTFESASAYDTRGELALAWDDGEGHTSAESKFSVNTEKYSEGEHAVTLRVKDERGHESVARAQLIITAKPEETASEQTVDTQVVSDDKATDVTSNALETEEKPASEAATETEIEAEPLKGDSQAGTEGETNDKNQEVLTENVSSQQIISTDQNQTESDEQVVTTISNNQDAINWGLWIWMLMIAIVLFPILWIINKLRGKPATKKQVVVTGTSPYNSTKPKKKSKAKVVSSSDNRFANMNDKAKPAEPKPAQTPVVKSKKSAKPDLVDFDLDVKPATNKSKKDELTDFNLDD